MIGRENVDGKGSCGLFTCADTRRGKGAEKVKYILNFIMYGG